MTDLACPHTLPALLNIDVWTPRYPFGHGLSCTIFSVFAGTCSGATWPARLKILAH